MKRSFLPVDELVNKPYSEILGFPRATVRQLQARVKELKVLDVTKVSFYGPTRIGVLNVLGKGHVGVVVLGRRQGRTVAIKIRRTDSQRRTLAGESRLLIMANRIRVGPKFVTGSRNFLVMEYLEGRPISDWMEDAAGRPGEIKSVLAKVLHDCFRLDQGGIDHGELGMISKHVIVGKKITIVDFESASTGRRRSNVTSATQGVYIGSGIARRVRAAYRVPPKQVIIRALRRYKQDVSGENFRNLLDTLKLCQVGSAGFEPATTCPPDKYHTMLDDDPVKQGSE